MTDLQLFLSENPVDNITEEVRLGGRLKDFKFMVKPLTTAEMTRYRKLCIKNANSAKKREFDLIKFNELLIINNVVTPSFKDADWIRQMNVATPEALLNKVLLAGEISELADKISEISGFNLDEEEVEELEDELKN